MEGNRTERVRVTLRWLRIKATLEPFYKDHGDFRFRARVTSGARVKETRLPESGHWEITSHPKWNTVDEIDAVLYEGPSEGTLMIELFGEELDRASRNDRLDPYRREFVGAPASWAGRYQPGDEGSQDSEDMPLWGICYDIEVA
jgi:hypothetical protein